jgi:hypothetical protein
MSEKRIEQIWRRMERETRGDLDAITTARPNVPRNGLLAMLVGAEWTGEKGNLMAEQQKTWIREAQARNKKWCRTIDRLSAEMQAPPGSALPQIAARLRRHRSTTLRFLKNGGRVDWRIDNILMWVLAHDFTFNRWTDLANLLAWALPTDGGVTSKYLGKRAQCLRRLWWPTRSRLRKLGITKYQSPQWQQLAELGHPISASRREESRTGVAPG